MSSPKPKGSAGSSLPPGCIFIKASPPPKRPNRMGKMQKAVFFQWELLVGEHVVRSPPPPAHNKGLTKRRGGGMSSSPSLYRGKTREGGEKTFAELLTSPW